MTDTFPVNPDLAWDLESFAEAQRARDFVRDFESTLCVFSPSVEQLYTTYNMFFPREWEGKLVILPDEMSYHDTFHYIETDAVRPTGLYIIPGELIERPGLFLANVEPSARSLGRRHIPFEAGMRAIMKKLPKDDPFLPVLTKGDLREFEQAWPVLHLQRLRPKLLTRVSELDRSSITNVITEKLESLFLSQRRVRKAG